MTTNKIAAERLSNDQFVVVRGKVGFSRIASQYTGEALTRRVEQQKRIGVMYPTTDPHTSISLFDAQLVPADPANPTIEEQFVAQQIFTSTRGEHAGKTRFNIDDKGSQLPVVLAKSPGSENYYQVNKDQPLPGELANGVEVNLVLRSFKSPKYAKGGIGLATVIVLDDEITYFGGGATAAASALASLGITVDGGISSVSAASGVVDQAAQDAQFAEQAAAPVAENTQMQQGFAMPTVSQPAAAAPVAPAVPAQAAPVQAPVAQAPAPAAQGDSPFDTAAAPAPAAQSAEEAAKAAARADLERQLAELG